MLGLVLSITLAAAAAPPPPGAVCIDHLETVGIDASPAEVRQRFEDAMASLGIPVAPRRKNRCPEGASPLGINILRVGPVWRVEFDIPGMEAPEGLSLQLTKALPDKEQLAGALRTTIAPLLAEPELVAPDLTAPPPAPAPAAAPPPQVHAEPAPSAGPGVAPIALWVGAGATLLASGGFGIAAILKADEAFADGVLQTEVPRLVDEERMYEYLWVGGLCTTAVLTAAGLLLWQLSDEPAPPVGAGILTGEQTGLAFWIRLP